MTNKLVGLTKSNYESNRITRESIQEAFIYLLSIKDTDEITVTEIVKKAGVSRAAYYKNYNTKDEILEDYARNLFSEVTSSLTDEKYSKNPEEWFYLLFSNLKPHEKTLKLLIKGKINITHNLLKCPTEFSNTQAYELKFFEKGLTAIISSWIITGANEAPQEMATLCTRLFSGISIIFSQIK